jgi:drug/metabolite transporter (DMT)-like permease
MSQRRSQLDAAASVLMVVLCACWGLNQVAIKLGNAGISPIFHAGLRSLGSAALVWAWSAHRGVRLFSRDGSLRVGLLVGALFASEFVFIYVGLLHTTASRAVLFIYTAPFVVAIGAHLWIPGERLRPLQVVGLIGAFCGLALAMGDALRLPTYRELVGDAMELVAAILWGATTVVIKASRLSAVPAQKTLFYQLAVSAVALPIVALLMGERGILAPTPLVIGMLAYQVIIVAFASYLTWFWLISRYPAGRLSAFTFLTPLLGLIAGAMLLGDPVSWALVAALLLVGFGIYLVNRPPPQPVVSGTTGARTEAGRASATPRRVTGS